MAVRVNATEVKELINTDLADAVVGSFIGVASRLVDRLLVGKGLDDLTLSDIELYLSAHFVGMRDQDEGMTQETKTGEANSRYAGFYSKGFELTRYGQMAIMLDTTGILSTVAKQQGKARFTVVAPVDT